MPHRSAEDVQGDQRPQSRAASSALRGRLRRQSQAKRWLLEELRTPEAIEAASHINPTVVKVKLYPRRVSLHGEHRTTMKGSVHDVAEWAENTVGQKVDVGFCHYYGDANCVHESREVTMPQEHEQLKGYYTPIQTCPKCKGGINGRATREMGDYPFMRGLVQRWSRVWWAPWRRRDYCALICPHCKEIVGWESPLPSKSPSLDDSGKGAYRRPA